MGLLTIIRKLRQKERTIRILMLGLDNAGKTTVVKKLRGEDVNSVSPTLGFNIDTFQWVLSDKQRIPKEDQSRSLTDPTENHELERGNQSPLTVLNSHTSSKHKDAANIVSYQLNIWDVGGQKSLRSYWRNYFEQTDGLVWTVDSSDIRRFEDAKQELHSLLLDEKLSGATVLILANKQDLPGALNVEEISKILDLSSIKNHHWRVLACSAKYEACGKHSEEECCLVDAFDWIVRDIASRIYMFD